MTKITVTELRAKIATVQRIADDIKKIDETIPSLSDVPEGVPVCIADIWCRIPSSTVASLLRLQRQDMATQRETLMAELNLKEEVPK